MKPEAIIFDLDGTLIDNNSFHIRAWQTFYQKLGRTLDAEEYKTRFNGKINRDIFNYIFQKELSPEEIQEYTNEKEALYRELYQPHIRPVAGLTGLLKEIRKAGIPIAIATSGLPDNIRFLFDNVPIEEYFEAIANATHVKNGKPHPEIFLKAAALIHARPEACIAFEDSVAGIRSAKAAGMKVVALTTTHTREDVKEADLIIHDYTEISLPTLLQLQTP